LAEATAHDSLAETPGLGTVDEDDLYAAMDRLLGRQDRIECRLAKRHLDEGALVLYELTSVYLEGCRRPLGKALRMPLSRQRQDRLWLFFPSPTSGSKSRKGAPVRNIRETAPEKGGDRGSPRAPRLPGKWGSNSDPA